MKLPRRLLSTLAALVCALSLPSNEAVAQSENLRVGFLTVRTGPLAAGGRQMEEGINLLLKERNYAFAGRKVDIIFADTAGQPALAKTKTQELVEREKVHVIIGPLATFEALAIDDYMLQSKVPLITPTSAAQNDLAQKKQSDYVIHVYGTAAQPMYALGDYAAKKLRLKRIAMIADDFTYGHEGAAGFHRVFEDDGGRIVQKLWPPLNVPDYGSFIGQLKTNERPVVGNVERGPELQRSRLRVVHRPAQDQRRRYLRRFRRLEPAAFPARLQGIRAEAAALRKPDLRRRGHPQEHGRRGARCVLGELVHRGPQHARQQALRRVDPRRVQGDARLLHCRHLHRGPVARGGDETRQGQVRGQARVHPSAA